MLLSASARVDSRDPCRNINLREEGEGNAEQGRCYAREQARINAEGDSLADKLTSEFRKAASNDESRDEAGIADLLGKAGDAIARSQESWKAYRDPHSSAVELSYTTERLQAPNMRIACSNWGRRRVRELRSTFAATDFSR